MKLLLALQPYWDKDAISYVILGSTGDPIQVPDVESFQQLIEEANTTK
jgi:hypothetical protein